MSRNSGYGEWVVRFRWPIIIATILMVLSAASGARLLEFSSNYRVYFSADNPQLNAFESMQDTYVKNDNVMIGIVPKDGNAFSRETLAFVEEVTKAAWQIPFSTRVESITNFQHTWANEDELVVEDLFQNSASLSDAEIKEREAIALAEPLLRNRLITDAKDITAVNVTINLPEKSLKEAPETVAFLRAMEADFKQKYPDFEIYLTGVVFINNAFFEAAQGDMTTLVPLMYLMVIGVMWAALRSIKGTLATFLVILFSLMTAMGLAGWTGIRLTPASANAPVIILTLAVADSIHFLSTMFHEMRQGKSKRAAIVESLVKNQRPIFITSVTTAIGFLTLNFSDSPPFKDLGNIVAMGVMAAFVYSLTFLPALMAVMPVKVRPGSKTREVWFDRLANFVIDYRRSLFWGMLALAAILISQIPRIDIDEKFNQYFDDRYQFRVDTDLMMKHRLNGFESIEYSLKSGESGGINNPEYLAKVDEFAQWFRQQPKVLYVGTITDTMKRLNKNMHADDEAYYKLPEDRELAAQYLLLYEMSLPFGLDLNNQINIDKSSTRFTVLLETLSTSEVMALERRVQVWQKENMPPEMRTPGASPLIMFSHIAMRNVQSMVLGMPIALLLISGILVWALRSFKLGAISLAPNLIPVFMTFGMWGFLFQKIGMAVSIVAPVALGIIVDDTVHFMIKYRYARRELGKNSQEAVRYSFHTVGNALWTTSLILVMGFGVLSFSGFTMNSHMGMMTTISIIMALLVDFFFLPVLLMMFDGKKEEGEKFLADPVREGASG